MKWTCVPSITVFAPAKINLFLAITGRRADGFHDLVSVAAPLRFGDELEIETRPRGLYSLSCDDASVPSDESNLVLKAARLFAATAGDAMGAHFHLRKKIPMGAGLGGGSSDATAALVGLNRLSSDPLTRENLALLAAQIGSDCALFLSAGPCIMRGRGELLERLTGSALARLSGQPLLVFKPDISINTRWAYAQLAANAPASYLANEAAELRLREWIGSSRPTSELIFNNMEVPAFAKFIALPTLLAELRKEFGLSVGMSGSGSACFALLSGAEDTAAICAYIRNAWGLQTFVTETETA